MPDRTFRIGGDLEVNRLGFGAMRITGPGILGPPVDPEEAKRVLRRAVELGVNFIDTADSYGPEVSESLIAEALHPYPDDLVIATKGGLVRRGSGSWPVDARPERLKECCEASLRRLRVDRIDVYQLHRIDPNVPLAESMGALAELKAEGKIRHAGVSNFDTTQLEEARAVVDVVSVQNEYSVFDRWSEPVLEVCERDGIAFLPWRPVGAGELPGELAEIAEARGATPFQIALAWLLQHSPAMIPIPGTGSVAHLEENMEAGSIELTADEMAALDALGR